MITIGDFPSLISLSARWSEMTNECMTADLSRRLPISRQGKSHEEVIAEAVAIGKPGWIAGWRPGWFTWGICFDDVQPIDAGLPVISGILSEYRGIHVAALSIFQPGTVLPMHDHPEMHDRFATFHLGLSVSDGAAVWSGGRFLIEETGRGFVFEGGKPHYAFNCAEQQRLILYVEFDLERIGYA